MPSDYTRKSAGHVLRTPRPNEEFYVFVARYWPQNYDPDIGDDDCVFDRWDKHLAPSPTLLNEYDESEPWAEWARKYVAEVGEETIVRRASKHAEDAGDRDVVFVCYEGEDERPRCHTWTLLSVLEGHEQTALDDFLRSNDQKPPEEDDEDSETCLNGNEWCPGPDGETLPCFECFDPEQDYEGERPD